MNEWESWQSAWREGEPPTRAPRATLERALARHRRSAWLYTSLDVGTALLFFGAAAFIVARSRAAPAVVGAASIVAFTCVVLGFAVWNRRDALFVSAAPSADFLARLELRLLRRERVPRFIAAVVALEIAAGLAIYAIWFPASLTFALALYGAFVVPLGFAWAWYARRLRQDRARLEALRRELDA